MDFEHLDFITYCVGGLSARLGIPQRDVYNKLRDSGILYSYLVPAYDSLHTFSGAYIIDDLVDYMHEKGVIA